MQKPFYQLAVYVPDSHAELVKTALLEAGAGRLGHYDYCCWETSGTGQFCPLSGSDPYSGEPGEVCHTPEIKLEMLCAGEVLADVIAALLENHPYETPAYHYFPVLITPPETGKGE